MTDNVIQFVPKANYGRSPAMDTIPLLKADQEARLYEHIANMPSGSYRGSHMGVPFFELSDTSPSEYSAPDGDCA